VGHLGIAMATLPTEIEHEFQRFTANRSTACHIIALFNRCEPLLPLLDTFVSIIIVVVIIIVIIIISIIHFDYFL